MRRLKSCLAAIFAICACNFASAQERGFASAIEWSPDGEMIAVTSSTGLWFFDSEFHELGYVKVNQGDYGYSPRSLDWNAYGDLVAIGYPSFTGSGEPIQIIDVKRFEVVTELATPAVTTQIEWNPTENLVAAGTWSGEAFVWDALTGEAVFYFEESDEAAGWPWNSTMAVCWLSRSDLVIVTEWETYVVDVEQNELLHSFDIHNRSYPRECNAKQKIIAAQDGMFNVLTGTFSETYRPWRDDYDLTLKGRIFPDSSEKVEMVPQGQAAEFSPDGGQYGYNSEGCLIVVYDTRSGKLLASIRGGIYFVQEPTTPFLDSLAWHPDGSRFAAVGQFGGIRIWDAKTFDLLQRFDGFEAGYGELSALFDYRSKHEFPESVEQIEALQSKCIEELKSELAKKQTTLISG